MIRSIPSHRTAGTLLALAALLLVPVGCAKRVTSVDAGFTQLEGTASTSAQLVATPEIPNLAALIEDLGLLGPSDDDTLISFFDVYPTGPGAIHTQLFDGTTATGYQFYRRESNGGLRQFRDFVFNSTRRWLDTEWEVYSAIDQTAGGYNPPTYVGRGLVGGAATANSPISNAAIAPAATPFQGIVYRGNLTPADSLFTMIWDAVPAAAGYWIHVYQFRPGISNEEQLFSGSPSAVFDGKSRDVFVAWVPAGTTTYRLGDPGALILTRRLTLTGQGYLVRITAVDANGQLVGATNGEIPSDIQVHFWQLDDTHYLAFAVGAVEVSPTTPTGPGMASQVGAGDTGTSERRGTFRRGTRIGDGFHSRMFAGKSRVTTAAALSSIAR